MTFYVTEFHRAGFGLLHHATFSLLFVHSFPIDLVEGENENLKKSNSVCLYRLELLVPI